MDSHIAKIIAAIPQLSAETWEVWIWDIESALTLGGQWKAVLAKDPTTKLRPTRPGQANESPTEREIKAQNDFDIASSQAASWIRHVAGIAHHEITQAPGATAASMLDALEALYAKQSGGARFDAWTELLAIRKQDSETFPDLVK
jgi:hypothetical protein